MKYRVWCDAWTDEEHALEIAATSSQDAAERYVERNFDEPFQSCVCHVIRPDGLHKQIRVDVTYEPTFTGSEISKSLICEFRGTGRRLP